ncbi:MAG TPA: hypothetical protein VJ599_00190, partial [Nitrososphaeraceae archaeon]|nr:hypothetical protein [Nitrososphaeraceae archaeon]
LNAIQKEMTDKVNSKCEPGLEKNDLIKGFSNLHGLYDSTKDFTGIGRDIQSPNYMVFTYKVYLEDPVNVNEIEE